MGLNIIKQDVKVKDIHKYLNICLSLLKAKLKQDI